MVKPIRLALSVVCLLVVLATASPARGQQQSSNAKPIASGAQGKIVLIQGHVDRAAANQQAWDPAKLFQALYVSDRVRTLTASRSAILLIDETQVKLNAGAVLTVQQIKTGGTAASTMLGLVEGEGWFRTKNPASGLTIKTPTASASIRGTEINLQVRQAETVLTVTEGTVDFSNDAGSVVVNAGEEATARPGQPPTKRTVLNPEDAVQWVLYYPTRVSWHDLPAAADSGAARAGFDRLKAGDATGALNAFRPLLATDGWARIGAAMAYEQLGDPEQSRAVLSGGTGTGEQEVERRSALAAAALGVGDARTARAEIEAALAIDRTAVRPLVILSALELTQNHKDEAAKAARAAVAAHPQSVAAHVAAAEAAQAAFDLDAAQRELDAALAIDAGDLRALVDRARIRFGIGDTQRARQDAERAAGVAPDDGQVRSLRGFIKLADGLSTDARADFEAAAAAEPALGEPHLGLGLLDFHEQLFDDGLLEMLTATLLEPKVSLYQSYLGKAYYQLHRFPEGLAALASAKRLDPRDPTPWLYTSFFLRDLNRQLPALDELRHAIALNDNRAVYRSRLLLDRDVATKNVSLAQLYKQLGFDAWGAFEALNSLNADLTNASAHLFMSDTYGNLPDRTQALSSELLQYFLYSPVNLNSFNNFSEYTALLEQPYKQALVTVTGGNVSYGETDVSTRSGNERFAHTAFVDYYRLNGPRVEGSDHRLQAFGQAKIALDASSDMFVSFTGVKQDRGQSYDTSRILGTPPDVVLVGQIRQTRDPYYTYTGELADATVGYKRIWKPGSVFTAASAFEHLGNTDTNTLSTTSACQGLDLSQFYSHSSSTLTYPYNGFNVQAQQATRFGRQQILFGGEYSRRNKSFGCDEAITFDSTGGVLARFNNRNSSQEHAAAGYVRDEIEIARRLHATVGARYDHGLYGDDQGTYSDYTFGRLNPFGGITARLSQVTALEIAGFRTSNTNFISSRIAPPTVAGFVFERNELPTSQRKEADIALQNGWSRTFLEVRGFVRSTVAPAFLRVPAGLPASFANLTPDADFRSSGISAYFNQVLTSQLSLFADEQLAQIRATMFDRTDNQVRVGLNYIHPSGFFARISSRFLEQRFSNTDVTGLPRPSFTLTDAELKYEFMQKRGLMIWSITNMFGEPFSAVIEGLSVEQPLPERRMTLSFRWRL